MIIQKRETSSLLITQPDHATLAATMMGRWRDGGLPDHPRRESILLAVREHDNGWEEVDRAPLVDESTGVLLDFTVAPAGVRRKIWPRGVNRLSHDPWAAALVAQHAIHVYRRYRGESAWEPFFKELEGLRDAHLRQMPDLTFDDLLPDYFFVRMGDLLSLTFCNGWNEGPEQPGYSIRLEAGRLSVTPDPFGGETIPLSVPARDLPGQVFASAADARRLFETARVTAITGVIQPHP